MIFFDSSNGRSISTSKTESVTKQIASAPAAAAIKIQ